MDLRPLAIELLESPDGIYVTAWRVLQGLLAEQGGCEDIIDAVRITDNQAYLPLDHECKR